MREPGISMAVKAARVLLRRWPFAYGAGRVLDRTWLSRVRFDEDLMVTDCSDGLSITVAPNDLIGRQIYFTGQFDRVIVDVLLAYAPRKKMFTFLDIGANIGYVSCSLLHYRSDARVVSVEPVPETFRILKQNIAHVGQDRAMAVNVAVSDTCGDAQMRTEAGNSGANHLIERGDGDEGRSSVAVQMVTGTELMRIAELQQCDLIKIDVEGHELTVLKSLQAAVERFRPAAIVFEHTGSKLVVSQELGKFFEQIQYQVMGIRKSLTRFSLAPVGNGPVQGYHDYVAVPASVTRGIC